MKVETRNKILKIGLPILLVTILIFGVIYAWLTYTTTSTKANTITAENLSLKLTDDIGINLVNAYPMTDSNGLKEVPYTFTLTNNGTVDSEYTIYLDDVVLNSGETRLIDNKVITWTQNRDTLVLYGNGKGYLYGTDKGLITTKAFVYTLTPSTLTVVINTDINQLSYYQNGELILMKDISDITKPFPFLKGQNIFSNYNGGQVVQGRLYAVIFYNRALTKKQVNNNYLVDKTKCNI